MRTPEAQKVFVFTDQFYFGIGKDIPEAVENARKAGGLGTVMAAVKLYVGLPPAIEEMNVDAGGGIHYNPDKVVGYELGTIRIPMRQSKTKGAKTK